MEERISHFLKVDKAVLRINLQLLIPFKDGFIVKLQSDIGTKTVNGDASPYLGPIGP